MIADKVGQEGWPVLSRLRSLKPDERRSGLVETVTGLVEGYRTTFEPAYARRLAEHSQSRGMDGCEAPMNHPADRSPRRSSFEPGSIERGQSLENTVRTSGTGRAKRAVGCGLERTRTPAPARRAAVRKSESRFCSFRLARSGTVDRSTYRGSCCTTFITLWQRSAHIQPRIAGAESQDACLPLALRGFACAIFWSGRLRPGSRLPATRDLAAQYGLSRGTVVSAFEELKSEGYLHGSRGSGTYVSSVLPEHLLQVAPEPAELSRGSSRRTRLSDYGARVQPFSNLESRPTRAFRANLPALDLFPTRIWTRIAERRLRRLSIPQLLGCDTLGYLPLRTAVADYLNTSRGTQCEPEQVMIVSGTQEALDLAARLILNPGDQVCLEEPGYPGAAMAFEALGAKICPVPVDSEGMELPGAREAKLVYVTPGHQFPVGTTMSLARRLQLLEWARRSCALIFEDDYDSEFRYTGRPIPALQGLDQQGGALCRKLQQGALSFVASWLFGASA